MLSQVINRLTVKTDVKSDDDLTGVKLDHNSADSHKPAYYHNPIDNHNPADSHNPADKTESPGVNKPETLRSP